MCFIIFLTKVKETDTYNLNMEPDIVDRRTQIRNIEIVLNSLNSLDKLKELCIKGKYKYHFSYEIYKNGMMCILKLYFLNTRKLFETATLWCPTTVVLEAQKQTAQYFLEKIGLSVHIDFESKKEISWSDDAI